MNHPTDKIELIIMGGTFLSLNPSYQENFIKGAYEGILNLKTNSLEEAKGLAEHSKRRLIGLTIETRPDYCKELHVDRMLHYGTTRVEIGIQTVFDEIYKLVNRGHTTIAILTYMLIQGIAQEVNTIFSFIRFIPC
mgnify:CR=1 FL=1